MSHTISANFAPRKDTGRIVARSGLFYGVSSHCRCEILLYCSFVVLECCPCPTICDFCPFWACSTVWEHYEQKSDSTLEIWCKKYKKHFNKWRGVTTSSWTSGQGCTPPSNFPLHTPYSHGISYAPSYTFQLERDGLTNRWTDMASYRVAYPRLKTP